MNLNTTPQQRKALAQAAASLPFGAASLSVSAKILLGLVSDVNLLCRELESLKARLNPTTNRRD